METAKLNAWKRSAAYKAGVEKAKAREFTRKQKVALSTKSSKKDRDAAVAWLKARE